MRGDSGQSLSPWGRLGDDLYTDKGARGRGAGDGAGRGDVDRSSYEGSGSLIVGENMADVASLMYA